jgi:hypothetical protein
LLSSVRLLAFSQPFQWFASYDRSSIPCLCPSALVTGQAFPLSCFLLRRIKRLDAPFPRRSRRNCSLPR